MSVFRDISLPGAARLVGYAALVAAHDLPVPLPPDLTVVGPSPRHWARDGRTVRTPAQAPPDTVAGHLEFALKREGVDLPVLHSLFTHLRPEDIETVVRAKPLGLYSRRLRQPLVLRHRGREAEQGSRDAMGQRDRGSRPARADDRGAGTAPAHRHR